jgi:methyltransferase-like protein
LKKELQKSHRRKAVRTEEARARRRRSRKSETHLFKRTYQRIEVTIKENFKRKWNLSDQLTTTTTTKNIVIQRGKPTISRKRKRRGCTDGATKQNSQDSQNRILLELENELLCKGVENLGAFIRGDNE